MSETTNLKLFKQDNPTTNTNNFDIEKTLNENWDKLDENAGTTNKKLESLEKVDSTTNETITAIKEEQTTQNENIEKNAEGIAQNKKDVDEELNKIKKENSLLKSQIPTGTASGNSIHLGDSSNMDFQRKLRGGSRQGTREGYNSLNVPSNFEITSSQNNRIVPISLKANTAYTINVDEVNSDNTTLSEILFRFRYNNQDVKYVPMLLRTKKVSFSATSDIDTVWIYSANNYNTSATTNTTFKNLMIYEGEEDRSYEEYGVSPSPDFPSEIKNVGDDVNLAYISSKTDYNYSSTLEKDAVLINGTSTNAGNIVLYLNGDDGITLKANKKYIVRLFFDGDVTGNGYKTIYLQGMTIGDIASNKMVTKEIILSEDKVCKTINLDLSANCTFDNMKVKVMITENGKLKEYIPYNCIKVTIHNKNLYKVEKVINDSNTPRFTFLREGNVEFTTGAIPLIIAPTTIKEKTEYTYILKCKSNVTTENNINFTGIYEDGTRELLSENKKKDTNEFIVKFKTNKEKTLAYVTQQYTNSAGVTIITEGTMILEGDYLNLDEPYEIHQEQEIIFPLAEGQKLRSLPNGVKDYLAEDGIHKNVGIIILNGSGGTNENYYKALDNKFALSINTEKGLLLRNLKTDNLKISVLSDKFLGVPWNIMKDTIEGWQIALRQDGSYTYLRLLTTGIKDTKALETFLQNNNAIVAYPLAEEEIIPYTQEQQAVIDKILYTYKNVTNISVDDELATLEISYKKDIETMFNNQAKEYNERLSNIENLLNTTETSALLLDNLENDLEKEV